MVGQTRKRVIITGGSDGLGLELSKLFLEAGYGVVCVSRTKPKLGVDHVSTDLAKEESVEKSIKEIRAKFPKFDALINCAGVVSIKPIDTLTLSETDELFRINVLSHMRLVAGLFDLIKENGADVVNVGSTVAFKAYVDQAAYVTSKWAVRGFTESLKVELNKGKSRVIGFYPGGMDTKFFEKKGLTPAPGHYMDPTPVAKLLFNVLALPKDMEVFEIIINRKSL